MKVPFCDFNKMHEPLKSKFINILSNALDNSQFIGSSSFEDEFKNYTNSKHCITCNSGTDALYIAIKSLELKNGSRIGVPAVSYAATAMAVMNAGHIPVFIDVDPTTALLDWSFLKNIKVDCVIPVHLFGQYCEIPDWIDIPVIEDCAQAHGLRIKGNHVGKRGLIGCFSFYPGKNLGALGDAGACITDDDTLADKMLTYSRLGADTSNRYYHKTDGINSRMDILQGLFLTEKLKYLDDWNKQRVEIAKLYGNLGPKRNYEQDVFHVFYTLTDDKEKLISKLKQNNIGYNFHYPYPLNKLPCFKNYYRDCPNAESFCNRCVSLPMFPGMTEEQVNYVNIHSVNTDSTVATE